MHRPRLLPLVALFAVFASSCSSSSPAEEPEDDGGENGGGGEEQEPEASEQPPETLLFFAGSLNAAERQQGALFPIFGDFDVIDGLLRLFVGAAPVDGPIAEKPAVVTDVLVASDTNILWGDARANRNESGDVQAPELEEIATLPFQVTALEGTIDPATNELWAAIESATGWSVVFLDENRNPQGPIPFPGEPAASLLDGGEFVGWLAESFSGDLTFVDKTLTATVVEETSSVNILGRTAEGVVFFDSPEGVGSYNPATGVAIKVFEGGLFPLNQLLVDEHPDGLVVGLREDLGSEAKLSLFSLGTDALVTDPFHEFTGLDPSGDESLVFAGGRAVVSARFLDTVEQRIESVALDGSDVDVVAAGDVPAFLPGTVFSSAATPYLFYNSGLPFPSGDPVAHAAAIDGSGAMAFAGDRWIGGLAEATLAAELATMIRLSHVGAAATEKDVTAHDASDPATEAGIGTTPDNVLDMDMGVGLGLAGLAAAFLEDGPERDMFLVKLLEEEIAAGGGELIRVTETPSVDERLIFTSVPVF